MAGARIISYIADVLEKLFVKDAAKDLAKDTAKDLAKDTAKDTAADTAKDAAAAAWRGEGGLTLTREENALADDFLARAKKAEPGITRDMTSIESGAKELDPAAKLQGLDRRLKEPDSLKRKLATDLRRDDTLTASEGLADMKDSVRYTLEIPDGKYSGGVNKATSALQDMGYQNVKWKPTWDPEGYKGINSFWRDPSTGQVFEVQFHTPASFDAKMTTHDLYDVARLPGTPADKVAELNAQQDAIFRDVPIPPGADKIVPPGS
ncbi:MAG: hypothetical protein ACM3ML_33085 [Micromonosporaceae bacterium]